MKKFLKIFGLLLLFCILICYFSFLFVLPNVTDLNKYKPVLQQAVKEQAKLDIDFANAQITATPALGLGVKIDDLSVKLPDNTTLFYSSSVNARIALPSLLLLTVKISCFDVENPYLNLDIADGQNMKIVKLAENIINENKQREMDKVKIQNEGFQFNPALIRIKIPDIKLNNYKIIINDIKNRHYLSLMGNNLSFGYFNGKRAKIKGDAQLFSDKNRNISAKFDINTFLPETEPSLDSEDDAARRIEFNVPNPVLTYRKYDLKTNIDTKLKIYSKNNKSGASGYLNIDDLTLKVSDIEIPKSYFHSEMSENKIKLDTDLKISENANVNLSGNLRYGKKPSVDMKIKSGKIYFNDLILLAKAFSDSLEIPNELDSLSANGYFEADTYVKTNFRKLKSDGFIRIKEGALNIKNTGKVISDTNINIMFDNDILNIKNSKLNLAGADISVEGTVDNSSETDINIKTDDISLPLIFKAFAPKDVKNGFNLTSGKAKFQIFINGKLKNPVANINYKLSDFSLSDIKNTFNITDKLSEGKLISDTNVLSAGIENFDFAINLPQAKSKISIPKFNLKLSEGNIYVDENRIFVNDKPSLTYYANIINYQKPKDLIFNLKGTINTNDLIKLIGSQNAKYFNYAGNIPVNISCNGNSRKQTLLFEITGNSKNYFTPLTADKIQGLPTSLQAKIDFKPNRIKIKDTGLFVRKTTTDSKGNQIVRLNEIIGIDGTIAGDTINLIKFNIGQPLYGKIFMFPNSAFKIDRSRIYVYGKTYNPRIRGRFKVNDFNIPELLLGLNELDLKLDGIKSDLSLKNLNLNNSEINIDTIFRTIQSSVFELEKLSVNSDLIDVDKVMKVAENAAKYFPADNTSDSSSQNTDIPFKISDGDIDIKHLKTGNINVFDIKSDLTTDKNVLYLNNLSSGVFDGNIKGNISTDLVTSLLNIQLDGKNINLNKMMLDTAGMKDTLSGITDFSANLSLKGSDYEEQMKSLRGIISFNAKNGQYGPFAKIENLIIAENIRESEIFKNALGGIIQKLTTIDTTHYNNLSGVIAFKDGICKIEEITSAGDVLMLHIFGDYDLLGNTMDMKIRAKMTSILVELLGPVGAVNPIRLVNSAAGTNIVTAKAFSLFCETLTDEEINTIPSFENKYVDMSANSNRFQLVAKGDVSKPLTLIKSFKWITTKIDFDKANALIASLPEQQEGSTAQTIEELIAENKALEEEKKTLKYKIKHIFSKKKKKNKEQTKIIEVSEVKEINNEQNSNPVKSEENKNE